jgi:hypothetical protein
MRGCYDCSEIETLTDNLSFEFVQTLNVRILKIVQDARGMEQQVALCFKFSRSSARTALAELHCPLSSFLVPITANHFCVKGHIFSQIESFANFIEIFPNLRRVACISRPVRTMHTSCK